MNKSLEYYLSLPYTIEIIPDIEEGGWVVKVKDLPGCMTQSDSWDEIPSLIDDAKRLWLEVAIEYGHLIPEPLTVPG